MVGSNWPGGGQGQGSLLAAYLFIPHYSFKVSNQVTVLTYQKLIT